MEKPVSIIVPVYNGEKYLQQCLNSLINQDYKNIKIYVVNDASTDNSVEIIKEFTKKDSRINLIDNSVNGGVSKARNTALQKLDSDYFTFVDCDDWVEPNFISKLVSMHDKNTLFTSCGYEYQKRSTKPYKNNSEIIKLYSANEAVGEVVTYKDIFCFSWNKLYKTSMLKSLVFPEEVGLGEDSIFNIHYIANNITESAIIKSTNQKLYHYIKTKGHLSSMSCNKQKFYKQKTLFNALESSKTLPQLKDNKEFTERVNSIIFLLSLQFIVFSKKMKLKEEKQYFKSLAKKYKSDYKKQKNNYDTFRRHGIFLYNMINMFMW